MGFGLKTWNNGGGLTVSSDGKVYSYLGRATLSSVVQPVNDININEAYNGYSSYSFTHAGDIIVALPLTTYGPTALIGTQKVGSTWLIEVMRGTGPVNSMGFDIQESTSPLVFGEPLSASGFGMAIYNAAGQLTGDLTRRPLTFDRYVEFPLNVGQVALASGISQPAIIGTNSQIEQTNTPYEPLLMTYQNRLYFGGFRMNPAGTFVQRVTWQAEFVRATEQFTGFQSTPPTAALIIEAAGLA
jgi:hypothetical protein